MIWNRAKECMSRDELAVLQGKRLVRLVKYMYQSVEYYRDKMQKLGMEPEDIRGIEDLEKLPFTTREDLMEAYPLGIFAIPNSKGLRYYSSVHNVGIETIAGYTQNDINVCQECMARSVSMTGLGEKDVIQVAYDYGLCMEGAGAHYGVEKVGAAVISMSDCKISALLATMRRLCVTGIIGTSSYLMRMAQAVEERQIRKNLQLTTAICGGNPWPESIQKRVQDKLGIKIYDIFGLNELTGPGVACECECQNGMHIQEDFFLAEVIDPHSLIVLPRGIRGELVFTTLQKEGIPLVRYRTSNITKINYEKCECGRTTARIDRICDGTDDILFIRGNSVFVYRIETELVAFQDIDACYLICIRKEHNLDVVDVYIDNSRISETMTPEREEDVRSRVAKIVGNIIRIEPRVQFAEAMAVGFSERRKVIIVDERRH